MLKMLSEGNYLGIGENSNLSDLIYLDFKSTF